MTVMLLWVCETCGTEWSEEAGIEPLRDQHGRVICEDCYPQVESP